MHIHLKVILYPVYRDLAQSLGTLTVYGLKQNTSIGYCQLKV